jgi:hypothetical protein
MQSLAISLFTELLGRIPQNLLIVVGVDFHPNNNYITA